MSPKIKRVATPEKYLRHQYDALLQRTSCTISSASGQLSMSVEDIPLPLMSMDLPLAADIRVNTEAKDPYWLTMRGWFTPQGGVLRCEESDVFLEIPPGAIPESVQRQEIIAKVALVANRFDFKMRKDELCLSPVVELLSPGLEGFESNVTINIPHRALLNSDWTFRVHYTQSHGTNEGAWKVVNENGATHPERCECVVCLKSSSDVTFQVTKTHFVIRTPHFSKYACSGCGKKRYLNLESFVSAEYQELKGQQQVNLNCYVVDTIKDYSHRVKENEGQRPSRTDIQFI